MRIFKTILVLLSIFFILGTLLPILQLDMWWAQIFVFPRIQISIILGLLLILWFIFFRFRNALSTSMLIILGIALCYQAYRIYPYTYLSSTQTDQVEEQDRLNTISAISSNVYMKNRNYQSLLHVVDHKDPDLVLLLEADEWWQKKMDTLQGEYPYMVSDPLDNTYGILLYSKLKLEEAEIRYMMEDSIPSIHAYVHLPSGQKVRLYCLHPRPPVPPESKSSINRDAELLLAGKMVEEKAEPAIVMGDLNDVAWSHTTRLFLKTSQMLDPRIGRGFYNTFNAEIPLLRWSLDHVFHTETFQLNQIEVLPYIGSDHFPIYFSLTYQPDETEEQEPLEHTTAREKDTVEKKIRKGLKKSD